MACDQASSSCDTVVNKATKSVSRQHQVGSLDYKSTTRQHQAGSLDYKSTTRQHQAGGLD